MAWEKRGEIEHNEHAGFHIVYGWFWKSKEQEKSEGSKELGMYWEDYGWGEGGALVIPGEARDAILEKYQDQNAINYFKDKD